MLSDPTQLSAELASLIRVFIALHHNEPFLLVGKTPTPLSSILLSTFVWSNDVHVVYADPSTFTAFPGWPLRNLLAAIAYVRKDLENAKFVCYRSGSVPSVIMHLGWEASGIISTAAVGWERVKGSLSPAFIDLRGSLDPLKLMDFSAELNLRLIRWRLVPSINLQRFSNLKCLILGAGTLGCNVARSLLGWGVKNFTFVDNARISYSNVDLKKYTFRYWNCIPALLYPQSVRMLSDPTQLSAELASLIRVFIALHHNEPFLLVGKTPTPLSSILLSTFVWSNDVHVVYADPSTFTAFSWMAIKDL
ncbi:hypothetical protein WUBG_14919 [Wuchereria bancrofti]|uniref:THIF-type NAD/FAD binding fold domain-containing protein n=1 Tax=Wuchereria bancrofti TaxID=6293 RepID=J9DWL9_WUCBA|nr:hypothetical protein WUBG_14919 [Wuchereria bancrofti]